MEEDELHERNIKITFDDEDKEGNSFVLKQSSNDSEIEISSQNESSFFIDTKVKGNPLYIIDGQKSTKKAFKKLDSKNIESMNILKGEAVQKKYGKSAKKGVIEVTTKKEK